MYGRIKSQPVANKTGIIDLDECNIFAHKPSASKLIEQIKKGLEEEGMGDIVGNIVGDEDGGGKNDNEKEREFVY
jgi:type III restriction enzyme